MNFTADDVRSQFLAFFRDRGHAIVPSAPVIPYDDPTLLFTNAGMNQFKDVFLGTGKREYTRAADSQKCIRVSGKHNDLEEVGRDTYHHTFFEMLGNWSFGDYYKKEAIAWAWELLTHVWGLDPRRLYATVFETDDEAYELWKTVTAIDPSHVLRFGKKDNFWEMGETGPCGPCSEIHIDLTPDYSGGELINAGDPRVMEIWNLVFIQYDRDIEGKLTPLPSTHVDTGMGFERMCAVLQGKSSNYDTDVFMPIIRRIAEIAGIPYGGSLDGATDIAMRVVADHVRMLTFSIADGAIPSNEGRGYVMRRILRRAARFGRTLSLSEPFIHRVVEPVVQSMGEQYPEIRAKQAHVERVIRAEEEGFNATLDRGLEIFESVLQRIGHSRTFPGEDAFRLYDTYGFPIDLTELMARERGYTVDSGAFLELMEEQRARSRQSTAAGISAGNGAEMPPVLSSIETEPRFIGYDLLETRSMILGAEGTIIVLSESPFYSESGGQVGDTGFLEIGDTTIRVVDAKKSPRGNYIVVERPLGDVGSREVYAVVDQERRRNIMRNHTATHLFHEALRRVVGTHAHQQGSLVAPDRLRFDFNHFERLSPDHIRKIEDIVNEKIAEDVLVEAESDPERWLPIEEAKRRYPNVKMFFGDKYGDRVRVVVVDPNFSVELCGGTHVRNTRDIGLFKIISESSVASGIRRIEAVTGEGLREYLHDRLEKVSKLDEHIVHLLEEQQSLERQLGVTAPTPKRSEVRHITLPETLSLADIADIETAVQERELAAESIARTMVDLHKHLSESRVRESSSGIESLARKGVRVGDVTVVASRVTAASGEELKRLGDMLREKMKSGVGILGAVIDDKVSLVCVVTDDLIKAKNLQAGKIVGELAKRVGGGGGGRPHLATAGGKDVAKLDDTLNDAPSIVGALLK